MPPALNMGACWRTPHLGHISARALMRAPHSKQYFSSGAFCIGASIAFPLFSVNAYFQLALLLTPLVLFVPLVPLVLVSNARCVYNVNLLRIGNPLPRIHPQLHPWAESGFVASQSRVAPAHLQVAEYALGVGHHGGEAPVSGGDCGKAACAAVGVERVLLGGLAVVVYIAHGG